jgi:hypothetical protein
MCDDPELDVHAAGDCSSTSENENQFLVPIACGLGFGFFVFRMFFKYDKIALALSRTLCVKSMSANDCCQQLRPDTVRLAREA